MAGLREVEVTRPMRCAGTTACRREGPSTIVAPVPAPQTASADPATYGFGAAARPRTASPSTAAAQAGGAGAESSAEAGGGAGTELLVSGDVLRLVTGTELLTVTVAAWTAFTDVAAHRGA